MAIELQGFPTEISDFIEMPNLAELMFLPQFLNVRLDDAYRFCGDDMRSMIDKAPLKHDKKYITISAQLQIVTPNTRTIYNKIGIRDEWHIDGKAKSPKIKDLRAHLLLSDCNCRTEFNLNPLEIDVPDDINLRDFNAYINDNHEKLGMVAKKVESNKFTTFENHMHRTSSPTGKEFRYVLRIVESDGFYGYSIQDGYSSYSEVFDIHRAVKSVSQHKDHVRIYNFD